MRTERFTRTRLVLWTSGALTLIAHAAVALYARHDRADVGPLLGGPRGNNWELPVARFIGLATLVVLIAGALISTRRRTRSLRSDSRTRMLSWLVVVMASIPLLVGPLALGFPWWNIRDADATSGLVPVAILDVASAAIALVLAWGPARLVVTERAVNDA
jgi:hypothetical protein